MSTTYDESVRWTEVLGVKFHSNEAGDGPVLVALHGGGPGANAWDNTKGNLDALAEHFHVILLDLPGYGRSEAIEPLDGEFEDQLQARAILAFLDAREITTAHVLGMSLSTLGVTRLAVDHPERVDKLIFKCPAGLPNLFAPAGPPDGIQVMLEFMKDKTRDNMAKVMHKFVPRAEAFDEAMVDMRYEAAMRATAPLHAAKVRPVVDDLARVSQPTLVLWGREDHMVSFNGALTALALLPNARVHIWGGGTGHFVEWEHPGEFNRLVIDFLSNAE